MAKTPELASNIECLGCHACEAICPTQSIKFSGNGFFTYPEIDDDTCVKCGKCEKVCKYVREDFLEDEKDFSQRFFCAYNTDTAERKHATSGGVGGALAKRALQQNWLVCGAAFDEKMNVVHTISDKKDILEQIRGSKYVQSDVTGIYKDILSYLKDGRNVLFIGTPCQCQALKKLVPPPHQEALLTCAIICHGVNSSKVWKEYVEFIEKKEGKRLKSYNFRSKDKGWGFGVLRAAIEFENSKVKYLPSWKNLFMRWFGLHYILQESCFHCPYRILDRFSDLTIGDFWGIEKILPEEPTREGLSVLIASTEKGMSFINGIDNLYLKETDNKLTPQKSLRGFIERRPESKILAEQERRLHFEEEYMQKGFAAMAEKYPPQTVLQRIFYHIQYRIKNIRHT